jgi:tetratricopeptide (TPR) repeat protein
VLAASLVLFTLLAGIAGTTIGLVLEAKQRVIAEQKEEAAVVEKLRAEAARDRTREVLDTMTSEITGDSLATQKEITAEQKKFLTEVLKYYKQFAGEKSDDELSRKRTAMSAARVGLIEYRLGRKEQSAAAFLLAVNGWAALTAEFPAVPEYRSHLASSHTNLGLLLVDLGKHADAEQQYHQALAIWEKLAAEFPTDPVYRLHLAISHSNLGILFKGLGKWANAVEQCREGLAIREKLVAEFPTDPVYRLDLAMSHSNLGVLLQGLGKEAGAEEQCRKGLAIREKLVDDFDTSRWTRQVSTHCAD